jgi:hypothetical protein
MDGLAGYETDREPRLFSSKGALAGDCQSASGAIRHRSDNMNLRIDQVTKLLLEESKRYLPCGHCGNKESATATTTTDTDPTLTTVAWTCSVCGTMLISND